MSALTDQLDDYVDGDITLETLVLRLQSFNFETPAHLKVSPDGKTAEQYVRAIDEAIDLTTTPNSAEEIRYYVNAGRLSREDLRAITEGLLGS